MTGCQAEGCRNESARRRLCEAHWQLDMIERKKALRARDREYNASQPLDIEQWTKRQSRIVDAMVARVNQDNGELDHLAELAAFFRSCDEAYAAVVRHTHNAGASWTEIAEVLGVSRQAARQRFGVKRDA